ncbi:MAG: amidase family protein [Bacteroidota bacterium]
MTRFTSTKRILVACFIVLISVSCKFDTIPKENTPTTEEAKIREGSESEMAKEKPLWVPYNDSADVAANADHEKKRMRYKFIQSKVLDKNAVFDPLYVEVSQFPEEKYELMKPWVLEQDIPTIQSQIRAGKFTYEELVLFYLYRIYAYELQNETTLNTVIALNPFILETARNLGANNDGLDPIYGMPILLKDNIGTQDMKTTAGAIALMGNQTNDAFIVERLKEKGALILGKVNLSEWANFICDCPNGQSAVGGQTLNPYGRREFDTGGSSAGSGTSVAANYAVAAVGTETSGSILSPSGQNSVVGLKPTVGLLSRSGIIPISSTLDTPGPMTKNVIDNGILLDAMRGFDERDAKSVKADWKADWYTSNAPNLKGKRFGALKNYIERDSLYRETLELMKQAGAIIIEFEPPEVGFEDFLSVLNGDMKNDLPQYIKAWANDKDAVQVATVHDVVDFNIQDSLVRIPYGQARFDGIMTDTISVEGLKQLKQRLRASGRQYFNQPMSQYNLDAVISINNYDAGAAAVAEYPALTVPMGYRKTGEPANLTFIAKQYQEGKLYHMGAAFEALSKARKLPSGYQD